VSLLKELKILGASRTINIALLTELKPGRMEAMIRVPTHRPPTHPGEMLREEFLWPMQIDEQQLAKSIHVPHQRIKEKVSEKRSINPSTALRLAKYFGMSPDFWMNLQLRWDLYQTQQAESADLNAIRPHVAL
jgi:addiction module HigA family antidote